MIEPAVREAPPRGAMMTMHDFWNLVADVIWLKSRRRSVSRLSCPRCEQDAKSFESEDQDRNGKAPLLPIDFSSVCPEYSGMCPRCGGELQSGLGF